MSRFHVGELCQVSLDMHPHDNTTGWTDCEIIAEDRLEDWRIVVPGFPAKGCSYWTVLEKALRKLPRDQDADCDFTEFLAGLKQEVTA